jgi:hypothetical protein
LLQRHSYAIEPIFSLFSFELRELLFVELRDTLKDAAAARERSW